MKIELFNECNNKQFQQMIRIYEILTLGKFYQILQWQEIFNRFDKQQYKKNIKSENLK